jgi:GxxExxY protein
MKPGLVHGDITYQIIGAAMRVHRSLGPGLLESVYEACLCHELRRGAIPFERQVHLPVRYDDVALDCGYVADIITRCVL